MFSTQSLLFKKIMIKTKYVYVKKNKKTNFNPYPAVPKTKVT